MGPVAAGAIVMLAVLSLAGAPAGLVAGLATWRLRRGLLWGHLAALGLFCCGALAAGAREGGPREALVGLALLLPLALPSLVCFLLLAHLLVRHLHSDRVHPLWTTLRALLGGLCALVLTGLTARLSPVGPLLVSAGGVLVLGAVAWRTREQSAEPPRDTLGGAMLRAGGAPDTR